MKTPTHDEFVETEVERALAPYRGLLPETDLQALEEMVRDTFENDPTAAALLAAARPRTLRLNSGPEAKPGAAAESQKKPMGES